MIITLNFYRSLALVSLSILFLQNHAKAQTKHTEISSSETSIKAEVVSEDSSSFVYSYKKVDSLDLNLTIVPSVNSQSKSPPIVFFFGGGWKAGSAKQFKPHAEYFGQRGLTGILVDYRVASRHNTTPFDAVEDSRDAVSFIIRHANELGIDKNSIVLAGGSAGGHLALMSSFLAKEKNVEKYKPAALVLFNPVIDTGPEGYGYERLGESYKTISPIDNIPDNPPPMIVFLGTDDKIINVGEAEDFCSEVKRRHGHCQLKLYKDQRHGFFNYRNTEFFIQTVREADQFLTQQQLIKGTPNVKRWMQSRN